MLQSSRIGCYIGSVFVGAYFFADDLFLMSPNRAGLQSMVSLCETFSKQRNLTFGTNKDLNKSKTKCIVFSNKEKQTKNLSPIVLYGNNLPWVQTVMHLGCTLQSNNSMSKDTMNKRGIFIGKVNSLLQELHFASPEILMKIINTNA